ncbi:MAG: V-type ATPase subunit [Candidatus Paceibacterota bacterium]
METSYIYSVSRVKALAKELLSDSDVDRLLTTSRGEEFVKAVKETYLVKFLEGEKNEDIFKALDKSLFESKYLISSIAPQTSKFDWLWIRYDLHNLRIFVKAKKVGLSEETFKNSWSRLSKYEPETLLEHVNNNTLNRLEPELVDIYEEAIKTAEEKGLAEADFVIDRNYFRLAKRMITATKDLTLDKILRLQIDVYNLKTRLRTLQINQSSDDWFVEGGNIGLAQIETKDQVVSMIGQFGNETKYREAFDVYNQVGHLTLIELALDEYFTDAVADLSHDIFSPASLVFYFWQCQNSAKRLQTILVGKENGQDNEFILKHLTKAYV